MCPVKSFEKMMSKLNPNLDRLWQRPRNISEPMSDEQPIWFTKAPIGANTIAAFMSTLSENLQLLRSYTNHCIRVTAITCLSIAEIETRHIMALSGHKAEKSIKNYSRRTPVNVLKHMSSELAKSVGIENDSHVMDDEPPVKRPALSVEKFQSSDIPTTSGVIPTETSTISSNVNIPDVTADMDLWELTSSQEKSLLQSINTVNNETCQKESISTSSTVSKFQSRNLSFCPNIQNCVVNINFHN